MSNCLELIYDRFGIDFYTFSGVQFKTPMMIKKKFLPSSDISILDSELYLSVGNFPQHTGKQIRSNDSLNDITTTVKEKKNEEQYTVELHFEFKQPTATSVGLCEALDLAPYHIILKQYSLNGTIAGRRVIRSGEGQYKVSVTEEKGIINVDIAIENVNGIQLIG